MGKTFGYTDKKLNAKAEKRGMSLNGYVNYLNWKQRLKSRSPKHASKLPVDV